MGTSALIIKTCAKVVGLSGNERSYYACSGGHSVLVLWAWLTLASLAHSHAQGMMVAKVAEVTSHR